MPEGARKCSVGDARRPQTQDFLMTHAEREFFSCFFQLFHTQLTEPLPCSP